MIERTEGHLRTSDGESIWYEVAGDGPPLVLAHGLGGNAAVWFQQLPHFAPRFRVVSWDQRGFGRSSNRTGQAGPQAATADLLALLDHLQIGTAHLVGQSMGGWAALGAALAAPSRVRSLVLACTTAGIPARDARPFGAGEVGSGGHTRPLGVHPAIGDRLSTIDPARAYLYQALGTFGDRPPDATFGRMLAEATHDPAALGELAVPALLICGARDPVMTPARVRDAASRLPQATVVEMPDRGHSPYFEDPAGWNAIVDEFLGTVSAP